MTALRREARTAGLLYAVLIVVGMFSPMVLESLVEPGDARATVENVLDGFGLFATSLLGWTVIVAVDVAVSVVLYTMFAPVGRTLSATCAAFRLVYATVLAAYLLPLFDGFLLLSGAHADVGAGLATAAAARLEAFVIGFHLALVFFGVHLILLGVLLKRSEFAPGALGVLTVVAGAGYALDALMTFFAPFGGDVRSAVLLAPALLAEVGLTGWLLMKGMGRGPREQVRPA